MPLAHLTPMGTVKHSVQPGATIFILGTHVPGSEIGTLSALSRLFGQYYTLISQVSEVNLKEARGGRRMTKSWSLCLASRRTLARLLHLLRAAFPHLKPPSSATSQGRSNRKIQVKSSVSCLARVSALQISLRRPKVRELEGAVLDLHQS